jgi:hypothetical protein
MPSAAASCPQPLKGPKPVISSAHAYICVPQHLLHLLGCLQPLLESFDLNGVADLIKSGRAQRIVVMAGKCKSVEVWAVPLQQLL